MHWYCLSEVAKPFTSLHNYRGVGENGSPETFDSSLSKLEGLIINQ